MTLSDYNTTIEGIEQMIYSIDVDNCELACEILKGVELPVGMILDIINPVIDTCKVVAMGLSNIGTMPCLEKALIFNKKCSLLNAVAIQLSA
jgi:hypothetical protein